MCTPYIWASRISFSRNSIELDSQRSARTYLRPTRQNDIFELARAVFDGVDRSFKHGPVDIAFDFLVVVLLVCYRAESAYAERILATFDRRSKYGMRSMVAFLTVEVEMGNGFDAGYSVLERMIKRILIAGHQVKA